LNPENLDTKDLAKKIIEEAIETKKNP